MQNDFEKQVRDKMKELDLVPSSPVWERVQEQIRQKKDRKRAIIWLPLLGLLLAGGIWWLNDAGNNHAISISHNIQTKLPSPSVQEVNNKNSTKDRVNNPSDERKFQTQKDGESINRSNITDPTLPGSGKLSSGFKSTSESSSNITSAENVQKLIKQPSQLKETKQPQNSDRVISGFISLSENLKPADINLTGEKNEELPTHSQPDKMIHLPNEIEKKNPDWLSEIQQTNEIEFKPVVKNLSSGTIVNNNPGNHRNWKFGFTGSAGFSGAKYGTNLFAGNKTADALRTVDSVRPPFIYNNSVSNESKTVRNNFAFSAGMIARKSIGNRFDFSAGVLYEYLSYNSTVGIRINQANAVQGNSNGAVYYTSYTTKQQEYLNQYHFISIPVTIHYQVLKNAPLSVNAGLSVKQLVKTNALEFNHTSQMYFYNRNAFNRTQLFPAIGVEYALLKNESLIIGPQFESSLIAFEKNGSNEHLFIGSLKLQWLFLKN